MRNQVQLITYPDRLGGDTLADLLGLLRGRLAGLFGGVHILPFFTHHDGADAGFDPIDHTQVDPRLGTWADVAALARDVPVMGDAIVNHMSAASAQFSDFLARGSASAHEGLFLTFDAVFPAGASERELLAVYRPRPSPPYTAVTRADGSRRLLWTTFSPQQIDIDVEHAQGRAYLESVLHKLAAGGVSMVRLDAVGYAIKRAGSGCFMLPETFAFIESLAASCHGLGLEVLVEVHSYYKRQMEIAARVEWVYDFALPPLLLHALLFRTAAALTHWISVRPTNAVTVLDTHDGIGIIDIGPDASDPLSSPGLVSPEQLERLVETIHANSGGDSRAATGTAASNLDLYQVNCTYFDALGRDATAYLIARAVSFFVPGVPQVYYVGLLAGGNDMALMRRTGVGRDINRHHFTLAEIDHALALPVVQQLLWLIRLRNSHSAFAGRFRCESLSEFELALHWDDGAQQASLHVDFRRTAAALRWSTPAGPQQWDVGSALPVAESSRTTTPGSPP